ncbi:sensor histidine kinase [Affinirhizobium pseudoryzae]|uniref:sensor histidine kinase n=1 Tax=Allorhizobium pseudoryzae TaxID=379684 RepID=UPI0013EE2EBC|nr:HWE histidine kinase domain-containing protein [Allorhizobium pseudoryzae]
MRNHRETARSMSRPGERRLRAAHRVERDNRLVQWLARLPAFRSTNEMPTRSEQITAYVLSLVIEAVAIALRFAIDDYLPPGFPYLTFFPAVILTGFCFGIRPALMNSMISASVAWYWFLAPAWSFDLSPQSITALAFFFLVIGIDLGLLQLLLAAYSTQVKVRDELAQNLQLQQLVSEEVDHRMKNLLATTSGLISLSQRHAATPQQLGSQLRQRIQAMGHSINLLRGSLHGGKADMREAILAALEPLGLAEGERLAFDGPKLNLNGSTIISLSLICHELGTNALKYGALSVEGGRIQVSWRRLDAAASSGEDANDEIIELVWKESGGPPVEPPSRQGFGTELVTRMASSFGGGPSQLDYAPDGLVVRFSMLSESVLAT